MPSRWLYATADLENYSKCRFCASANVRLEIILSISSATPVWPITASTDQTPVRSSLLNVTNYTIDLMLIYWSLDITAGEQVWLNQISVGDLFHLFYGIELSILGACGDSSCTPRASNWALAFCKDSSHS